MAVRELEKELAAKQNKLETPQMTKKQQDMIQQQLDQEQLIRDSVRKVSSLSKSIARSVNHASLLRLTKTLEMSSSY